MIAVTRVRDTESRAAPNTPLEDAYLMTAAQVASSVR